MYGGLTITEPRARLAELMNEITPKDITGFIFPLGGSDGNEIMMRVARMYTGKNKILNRYRSFHGGSSGPLNATGDFRRRYADTAGVGGFVKFFDLQSGQYNGVKTMKKLFQIT